MKKNSVIRTSLLLGTGLAAIALAPVAASAQTASEGDTGGGLEEIVVTAQKREQSIQDVPVAVTAISQASLVNNRVVNVADLSGLAPNVTVRPAAGGTGIAMFTVRGVNSYGVAPGSDKQVSINLDGVYISSARGSIFDMPDIERIEILRGPQGTLFGRNATAGAVSIVTRGPSGKFGITQSVTMGNYDQLRSRTTIDLPAVGPFSAYVSYIHNERRGDVRNTGAGTLWDKTSPLFPSGKQYSPKYLGSHNSESFAAALKFEPSSSFKATYKFDWTGDHYTPEANIPVFLNTGTRDGRRIQALINNQPAGGTGGPIFSPSATRIKATNNWWTVPGYQRNSGHNLTAELRLSDNMSLKNIAAYRSNFLYGASDLSGISGLVVTQAAIDALTTDADKAALIGKVGNRLHGSGTQRYYQNQQWSNELQFNYDSDLMNLTLGAIYFHSKEREGGPDTLWSSKNRYYEIPNATGLMPQAFGGVGANTAAEAIFYNKATSYAAYGQAEVHVSPVLDIVAGLRFTRDKKSGSNKIGGTWVPTPGGNPRLDGQMVYAAGQVQSFQYRDSQPSYSLGINYKPNSDLLVYGKYSRSYVSGGQITPTFKWKPEIAKSWEAGVKATLLDGRLRTNLAVFTVTYDNLQLAQGGATFAGVPGLESVVNIPVLIQGMSAQTRSRGFELEVTAMPTRGLTIGSGLGYTDVKFKGDIDPLILITAGSAINCLTTPLGVPLSATEKAACSATNSKFYKQTVVPKWTANVNIQYESEPVFEGGYFSIRLDANFRSKYRFDANTDVSAYLPAREVEFSPSQWLLNGRVALTDMELGALKTTFALWGRNLTNDKSSQFRGSISGGVSSSVSTQQARTFGADLTLKF